MCLSIVALAASADQNSPPGTSTASCRASVHGCLTYMMATAPLLASSQIMSCRRARHVVTEQAGDGLRVLQTGVRDETEFLAQTFSNGIGYVQQGPRQIQAALSRVQRRIEESRLQALLEVGIAETCKGFWLVACCTERSVDATLHGEISGRHMEDSCLQTQQEVGPGHAAMPELQIQPLQRGPRAFAGLFCRC